MFNKKHKLMPMRLLPLAMLAALTFLCSCNAENEEDKKRKEVTQAWINQNADFFNSKSNEVDDKGHPYYERVVPAWNRGASVLMHWFNDRDLTSQNLQPMLTSKVQVKYEGKDINDVVFDNSYSKPDSLFETNLSSVIEGWTVALSTMHVGDSVQVIIPSELGYGSTGTSSIKPYSTLQFNIKLVKISAYEVP